MGKQLLPQPGVTDELGSVSQAWQKIVAVVVQDAAGNLYLKQGFDASMIGGGTINPARIALLNSTILIDGSVTLASVIAAASAGGGDPVPRINTGTSLINGSKIANGTTDPAILDATKKLVQAFLVGTNGYLQSDDYDGSTTGFKLSKTELKIFLATAVWAGILQGTIDIGNFDADSINGLAVEDPTVPNSGFHVDQTGRMWFGSDTYDGAPVQFDQYGNFYLNSTPTSLSRIDAGAIDLTIGAVQPSQAGGQFSGLLTLTALTRGAQIFYTTDGSDPSNSANSGRVLYSGPFSVVPSGSLTVKAVAYKLGTYGPIGVWVFTASANTTAAPTFNPIPGFYTTQATTFPVALSSGTPGASLKYTTDGSDPGPANGTIYTTPILIPRPSTNYRIRAYAFKAGLVDSAIVEGDFTIKKGSGQGGGGGNTP